MPTLVNNLRAIRGPVTAVPMVGASGVVVEPDTVNNQVVVRADETVLWEGTYTAGDISLSESITNFERIAILYAIETPNTSGTYNTSSKWIILDANSMYLTRKFHLSDTCNNGNDANSIIIRQQSYTVNNDNKGFTKLNSTQLWYNGSSWILAHNGTYICKVIGINRIAG